MFERSLIHNLKNWAESPVRKPLVLRGARQVGKTSLVKMFSKQYDHFIYLNLDKKEDLGLFTNELDIHSLFEMICLQKRVMSLRGKTLLFVDEIQNSPRAIAALRYFYEDLPEIHVIAAGSLLETISLRNISFPVGRVEFLPVKPCSFPEFLAAIGENQSLDLLSTIPFPEYAHQHLINLFNTYTLIGGMPEVVDLYAKTKSILVLNKVYESLTISYIEDFEKYAVNQGMAEVMRHIFEHAFMQAAERIKFQGFGNASYKNREMSEAFRMMEKSFLLQLIYPITNTQLPAISNYRRSPKLQLLDTGLVNYISGIQGELINTSDLNDSFRGRIAEQITGQELLSLSDSMLFKLNYWTRENKDADAEVDFIWQHRNKIIPIEVKSGKAGKLRSLHQFMNTADHDVAVRVFSGKFNIERTSTIDGKAFRLFNLPFYLIHKLPDYLNEFWN
jgi:predicted AAA+ superfamily ATPase